MNTVIVSILGLLALSSRTLVWSCVPDSCAYFTCPAVDAATCVGGLVRDECNCCDICLKILGKGDNCFDILVKTAIPKAIKCANGMVCQNDTQTCEPINKAVTPQPSLPLSSSAKRSSDDNW